MEHRREGEEARGAIAEDFRKVYDGVQTAGEVAERLGEFVAKGATTYPGLRALPTVSGLFTYLSFSKPMRKSIYTSNVIESFNAKAKRELAKRVSMNSLGNVLFCMTQIAKEYNRHARKMPGRDEMTDEELDSVGMLR